MFEKFINEWRMFTEWGLSITGGGHAHADRFAKWTHYDGESLDLNIYEVAIIKAALKVQIDEMEASSVTTEPEKKFLEAVVSLICKLDY